MKKSNLLKWIKILCLCVCIVLFLTGCEDIKNSENNINEEYNDVMNAMEDDNNILEYYSDDKSINLFINKYNNKIEPKITADMISKKHIGGKDRDDVVNIANNEKLDVVFYGNKSYTTEHKLEVYIGYKNGTGYTNGDFKAEFEKYIKLFDESIENGEIDNYWDNMISNNGSIYKLNNIDITINIINGNVQYFKITSKINLQ